MGASSSTPNSTPITTSQLLTHFDELKVFRLGDFRLKSGQRTPIYVDLRQLISDPPTLRLAATAMCERIRCENLQFDAVVGVPYAALPLATIVCDILNVPMLMKRKEAKDYGTKQLIEGLYEKGWKVLLVEDVVVHGDSIRETAEALREAGLQVEHSIAIVDRQQGAVENLRDAHVTHLSVLTLEDILDHLIDNSEITEERKAEIIRGLHEPF